MSEYELISVIVVTYNSAKTIIDTLDSIKAQTYPNIEIIVTDDCSKDDTIALATTWLQENHLKGTIVSANTNKGVPANMNQGLRASSSRLFKFIAGDDLLYPNAIDEFYRYYQREKFM